ncbi:DUF2490 domain-containing protein [Arachidicoccus terrestris]|uniref:DUF2490 domain-containing protein n=1 Tax=Arachidicoccus terrestris TaxID=2875539 RepID=UPI001CC77F1A|nr:DUF2490 domain-containing protein [Arachidicoccus terrestris]UAY56992.1 DUF2490 domain-containing protein [Arachidicoccus terrestris]
MQYLLFNTPKGGLASCNIDHATNGCIGLNHYQYTLATYQMKHFAYKPLFWIALGMTGFASPALSQKQVTRQSLYWIRYYGKYKLSDNWGLNLEIEDRHFFKNNRQSNWFLPRVAVERKLGKGWAAGAGFSYYLASNPADPAMETAVTVPELRPHQYLSASQSLGNLAVSHRFQFEERWIHNSTSTKLTAGYHFQGRARYRFQLKYPLIKQNTAAGTLNAIAFDEILLNLGHNIVANTFDQNRIYFGLNYGISKAFQVELGYLDWFQERSSGNQYYHRDIARLTIYHDLKLY